MLAVGSSSRLMVVSRSRRCWTTPLRSSRRFVQLNATTTTMTTRTTTTGTSRNIFSGTTHCHHHRPRRGGGRRFSTTTTTKTKESSSSSEPAVLTKNSSPRQQQQQPQQQPQQQGMVNIEELYESAPKIQHRHGNGDGVIELNVGGKSFLTLRSTIEQNPMLWYHVHVAEQNQEFINGTGAVFIDRDSTQFGLILQHLRNQATGLQLTSSKIKNKLWGSTSKASVSIQIPTDRASRQDLFMEARYFQIYEIQDVLCHYDIYTRLASFVGGGSANPFTAASELMKTLRRMLLATGGTGMVVGGVMNEDLMKDITKVWDDVKGLLSISSGSSSSNSSGGEKQSNPKQELPSSPSPSPSPSPSSAEPSLA